MAYVTGGELVNAVNRGGGMGLIGGGYGEQEFIEQAWKDAGNARAGIGFITWSLAQLLETQPDLLNEAIAHNPSAIMLSFGVDEGISKTISDANIPLICQCQTMAHVQQALNGGAQIIVAQGTEAGGHCGERATLAFVPEVADYLSKHSPQTLLVAAGGIADGRGLAAALMLGADGVLIGTRFWASQQAMAPKHFQQSAMAISGDDTIRTDVPDIARSKSWPTGYAIRVANNALIQEYHGRTENLAPEELSLLTKRYVAALQNGKSEDGGIIVGEAIGMISDLPDAAQLTQDIGQQALDQMKKLSAQL